MLAYMEVKKSRFVDVLFYLSVLETEFDDFLVFYVNEQFGFVIDSNCLVIVTK